MTKVEFLAMSLPYGVIAMINQENIDGVKLENRFFKIDRIDLSDGNKWPYWTEQESFVYQFDCSGRGMTDYETLPVLHPLTDLTKLITHNGETFVPMNRLVQIFGSDKSLFEVQINEMVAYDDYHEGDIYYHSSITLLEHLLRWHFDLVDLISKNEAIDVNTLEVNPYA